MTQTFSTRTVCCKLSLDAAAIAAMRATAEAFNAAATSCASVAWEQRITNKNKLHRIVYRPTPPLNPPRRAGRAGGGCAQLACCARDKAAEAVRAARANGSTTCSTFRPDGSIRYDARTYRLMSLDRVSLKTLTGRVVGQLVLGEFQRRYLYDTSWTIGGAELVQRDGAFSLHITQTKANPAPDEPTGVLGVDLGIVNLATDSDGETFSGAHVTRVRERRFSHRQRLQHANTRRARWRLRKNARREARFQRDVNHCISKKLVAKARAARKALALGDLTGIRERGTVRRAQRRARHSWAFRQLRSCIAYKAAQAGVRVILVDPPPPPNPPHGVGGDWGGPYVVTARKATGSIKPISSASGAAIPLPPACRQAGRHERCGEYRLEGRMSDGLWCCAAFGWRSEHKPTRFSGGYLTR